MKNRQQAKHFIAGCVLLSLAMSMPLTAFAGQTDAGDPALSPENEEARKEIDRLVSHDPLRLNEEVPEMDYPTRSSLWFMTSEEADGQRLRSQTRLLFGVGLVTAGVLYCLPESVTHWDRDAGIEELPGRWWRNVSRRPVWDKDDWTINYIGHTYCGGVYYQMARKSGFSQWDSFVYTTLMSTFFWEYGLEAFAERPSIQDLVVTPLGGWLYGEWAFRCEQRIEENDSRVLGSKTAGSISLFFLDPIDRLGQGVNRLFGREWVLTGRVTLSPKTDTEQTDRIRAVTPGVRVALQRAL